MTDAKVDSWCHATWFGQKSHHWLLIPTSNSSRSFQDDLEEENATDVGNFLRVITWRRVIHGGMIDVPRVSALRLGQGTKVGKI